MMCGLRCISLVNKVSTFRIFTRNLCTPQDLRKQQLLRCILLHKQQQVHYCQQQQQRQQKRVTEERISKNIAVLHNSNDGSDTRPLVLLFGWLFAKPTHLKKFSDFYVDLGFDVITVQIFLGQLLRPKKVQALMRDVLDISLQGERAKQPIVFHTLSVGGYMYGECLMNIRNYPDKYGVFGHRIHGQIFDSVIDFYGIPRGVAYAATRNEKRRSQIIRFLTWYLDKFKTTTTSYVRASGAFHDNEFRTPSLFLYSHSDPVSHPEHYERLAKSWRDAGVLAETQSWADVPHVSAFKMHPDEYRQHIINFLKRTKIRIPDK